MPNLMIPNIDTHLHLGGCIPPEFVWNVISSKGLKHLAEKLDDVVEQMTFRPGEPQTFHRFLDKFRILDEIEWSEDLIDESIKSISLFLQDCNVHYAWLDFSINKYMSLKWHKIEAIRFIHESFQRHRPNKVGLILSIKYESSRPSQRQYAQIIEHEDALKYLVGIDLVGDEAYFDSDFYQPLFKAWNDAGMITRAHVGESSHADNIIKSIEKLRVTNIAHGFKIIEDMNMIKAARYHNITFDLALTSNVVTNVCNVGSHPINRMISEGLNVTLGSDDPIQCNTTLEKEYQYAHLLGIEVDWIKYTALYNTIKMIKSQGKVIDKSLLIDY